MTSKTEPIVTVMPPVEAYDFDYIRARVDAELLSGSIAIRVFRIPLLAVPVGRTRRGGSFGVDNLAIALAVRDVLASFGGFSDLRIAWHDAPRSSYVVAWGDRPPTTWSNDDERLAFYGLTRGPALAAPAAPLRLSPAPSPRPHEAAEEGPESDLHVRKEDLHVSAQSPLPHRARG
ncbi:DUF6302 family protein [Streptomyces mutabilis]|uniref:DUF6302 family protein n=1 Tax=Streptomyces mutabilis TaxID=67332 RepID=UPI0036BA53AB